MPQLTPGNWTLLDDERSIIVGGGPNNDDIAEFFFKDTATVSIAYDEAVANATLFLHAREVLAALKALAHVATWDEDSDRAEFDRAYQLAVDALAKASPSGEDR